MILRNQNKVLMKKRIFNLSNIACVSVYESDMRVWTASNSTKQTVFANFCDTLEDLEIAFDILPEKGKEKVTISFMDDPFVENYSTKLCALLKQYVIGFSEITWKDTATNSVIKGINTIKLAPKDFYTSSDAMCNDFQSIGFTRVGGAGIHTTVRFQNIPSLRQQTSLNTCNLNIAFQKVLADHVSSISEIIWN